MSAVIHTGGKQYRVKKGDIVLLEKLEAPIGDTIKFDKVLLVTTDKEVKVGSPYLPKTIVSAEVIEQLRGDKVKILKFKRRKHHMKRQGHRQWHTKVKITDIITA